MKLIFQSEDCIVGLVFGVLILALSKKMFQLTWAKTALTVIIPIYVIVIFLDVIHEFSDLSRHPTFIGISILHNLFDLTLCVGFYSLFFNYQIPFISNFTPMLNNQLYLYYIGLFELGSHLVWLVISPFNTF